MPDLALDLRYLRYALLVAEHGSFRRAAEAIDISQSTMSRRVQLLERRLGVPLFIRSRTGAKLTIAGARFLQNAAFGASHLHQAVKDMQTAHQGDTGEIRIGLMTSLASGFLPNLVGESHSRRKREGYPIFLQVARGRRLRDVGTPMNFYACAYVCR